MTVQFGSRPSAFGCNVPFRMNVDFTDGSLSPLWNVHFEPDLLDLISRVIRCESGSFSFIDDRPLYLFLQARPKKLSKVNFRKSLKRNLKTLSSMKKSDLKDTEVKYVSETDIKRKSFFQRATSKFNIKIDKWFVQAQFREISKFSVKPKLSFLREIHKNDNQDEFLDFYEFIIGIKIREITLVILFVIFSQDSSQSCHF